MRVGFCKVLFRARRGRAEFTNTFYRLLRLTVGDREVTGNGLRMIKKLKFKLGADHRGSPRIVADHRGLEVVDRGTGAVGLRLTEPEREYDILFAFKRFQKAT